MKILVLTFLFLGLNQMSFAFYGGMGLGGSSSAKCCTVVFLDRRGNVVGTDRACSRLNSDSEILDTAAGCCASGGAECANSSSNNKCATAPYYRFSSCNQ